MAEELDRAAAQLPMPERIQSTQVRPRLAGPLPDGQLPSGPPPHRPHSASIPPTPTSLPPTTHPSGISQVHGPLPVAEEDDTPLWQHWTLVGLIALLVFLGVIALTIVALG